MQFNLLDYVILVIIFFSLLVGFKLGFIKAITRIFNTILAIILGFLFYDDFLIYLNHYFNTQAYLTEFFCNKFPIFVFSIDVPLLPDSIPVELAILNDVAETFSYYIMIVISFLIIFIISKLVLRVLTYFLEGLFSFSILSWINRLLGMLILPAKNLLLITIFIGLIYPAIELAAEIGLSGALIISELIKSSIITGRLLNYFEVIKALVVV